VPIPVQELLKKTKHSDRDPDRFHHDFLEEVFALEEHAE